ncbi:MAG: indolepyruvate oxidoreductase subunit beta [Desulfobacula sp.]|uniref:indolepyruvate oxidoreductase subunit beta n=1 Tax=Desulfobacula sp. TaxID=2593537 RepID=UPI0025B8E759|nr:indolepyruvate oxidoreductase subunit beta [Desulfobacula sp.]MCD4722402.1 indolepyruvate oxidoreductase subunit beta [Desulfobacula sp.]
MKTINYVLTGLGGQGILFMTKIFATAALNKGYSILGAETHGMAQRGGSVVSHLRIGEARSSLIRAGAADFLLSMDESEAYRYLPYLKKGGKLFANASPDAFPDEKVSAYLKKQDIEPRAMEAAKTAMELGGPRSTNLAMVAFYAAFGFGPLNADDLRATVDSMSPGPFKETNLKIFDACYDTGKSMI